MTDLSSAISALQASSIDLNRITDSITDAVSKIEDSLNNKFSTGVYAHTLIYSEPDFDDDGNPTLLIETAWLCYGRKGTKFQIYVRIIIEANGCESTSERSWGECRRELKLQAAMVLPNLIEAITNKVHGAIAEAKEAENVVNSLLSAIQIEEL